jgi:membrane protein DedA with SNARE-associated domain
LNYWVVLGSAIAGAVLGDNFGYWIGRFGGWTLLRQIERFFKIPEKQLEEARQQFSKNAPRAVFFGRFVALLRIFAGPMAGIAQMPYAQFLLCNFGGATVWATIMVTVSFFLGRLIPLNQLVHWMAEVGVVALIVVLAWVAISFWLESRKSRLRMKTEQEEGLFGP